MVTELITVEVAYATTQQQTIIAVTLPGDSTALQAIVASGLLIQFPEIDLKTQKMGIYGQICSTNKTLVTGDRVELYRALQQNPMEARRARL